MSIDFFYDLRSGTCASGTFEGVDQYKYSNIRYNCLYTQHKLCGYCKIVLSKTPLKNLVELKEENNCWRGEGCVP